MLRPEKNLLHPPGQIVNNEELDALACREPVMSYKPVKTLGDYIDNTLKHEAMMERQANKKKLTFEEWYKPFYSQLGILGWDSTEHAKQFKECWKAAQENV